ncbi:sterol desaturas-like protein family [Tricladium varicosporioides]|nr:sterol desaturas-like protein family [Hymenoscyphus varicosporioides]
MDALLSVPILGYVFGPSTFSTSLNLLFFYMTWSTLVLSQPPLKVEILSTLAIRIIFFLIPSLLFLAFDTIVPSLAVNIKTQGEAGFPTRNRQRKGPFWYQASASSIFNILLSIGMQAGVELLLTEGLGIRSALQVTTTLPMPWSLAKHVLRNLLLREIIQYYIHRLLLHPSRPTYISKLHTSYAHSITSPYSLSTHYDHPTPYLLHHFLPTYLPSAIFRTHLLTYLLTLSIVTLEETLSMSGYSIVPGIMLSGITRRQNFHYQGQGKGNFAPWGLMDWVHGSSIGSDVVDDLGEEVEKHNMKERGGEAIESVKKGGREGLRSWSNRRRSGKKP